MTNQEIPTFFEANDYLIDQKVNMFKFENEYKVFNTNGERIGGIKEHLKLHYKSLSFIIGKGAIPFHFEIIDTNNQVLATISKGWTFWLPKIHVKDHNGNLLGILHQKMRFFKPTFFMHDSTMKKIGEIKGDWRAWNFNIQDENGKEIGSINKKWNGILREAFSTADKYHVSIKDEYQENQNKIVIVSIAISIDMVLKESK